MKPVEFDMLDRAVSEEKKSQVRSYFPFEHIMETNRYHLSARILRSTFSQRMQDVLQALAGQIFHNVETKDANNPVPDFRAGLLDYLLPTTFILSWATRKILAGEKPILESAKYDQGIARGWAIAKLILLGLFVLLPTVLLHAAKYAVAAAITATVGLISAVIAHIATYMAAKKLEQQALNAQAQPHATGILQSALHAVQTPSSQNLGEWLRGLDPLVRQHVEIHPVRSDTSGEDKWALAVYAPSVDALDRMPTEPAFKIRSGVADNKQAIEALLQLNMFRVTAKAEEALSNSFVSEADRQALERQYFASPAA